MTRLISFPALFGVALFCSMVSGQGIVGFLDAANYTSVSGWACFPAQPGTNLFVNILVDNRPVGTVLANQPREAAVGAQCGGNPNHGFVFVPPSSLQQLLTDGQSHSVSVRASFGGLGIVNQVLSNSPQTITVVNQPPIGVVDTATMTTVSGWACDPNSFSTPIRVDLYIDNNFVVSTTANQPREAAVGAQCGGFSSRGFVFNLTPQQQQQFFAPGAVRTVQVYGINIPNGNNPQLTGSPKTVASTPSPSPITRGGNTAPVGFLDSADITRATGWACDADVPNFGPIQVHIYVDNVFVGATTANLPREAAVGQQCGGNANVGFSFSWPSSTLQLLRNGSPHTVQAYAINVPTGDNPLLSGAPKTIPAQATPTPSPSASPNRAPIGFLDTATRTSASGWACDLDVAPQPVQVHIYVDNVFAGATTANLPREAAVAQQCNGQANAGWTFTFPASVQQTIAAGGTVQAYAINVPTGTNPQLSGSPKNV